MNFERDIFLAKRLQKEFDEEAKRRKRNENNINRSNQVAQKPFEELNLIDPKLEVIDPNPDIHALFIHFDKVFFWKKLIAVEVKWSPRMTSCAGICCYQGRGGLCSIRLSLPLLKLRPRKDLIETLLHEMIHAYLFVTHNNRDRDGHGPEFHKHMHRINKSAGTKITVYHTFHDEVRSYQQHWWKCQGPCQKKPPYFGMVRRAMNRAPGPYDTWWSDHQASCGGTYVKVREPEGYSANKKAKGGKAVGGKGKMVSSKPELASLMTPKKIEKTPGFGIGGEVKPAPKSGIYGYFSPLTSGSDRKTSSTVGGFLGNRTSQVSSLVVTERSKTLDVAKTGTSKTPFIPFTGKGQVLGGGNSSQQSTLTKPFLLSDKKGPKSVKNNLVKRSSGECDNISPGKRLRKAHVPSTIDSEASSSSKPLVDSFSGDERQVKCPVCNSLQNEAIINDHLDGCIASQSKSADDEIVCLGPPTHVNEDKELWYLECPGCRDKVKENEFDHHLNSCDRIRGGEPHHDSQSQDDDSDISSNDDNESPSCPICGQCLFGSALGAHLDTCLSSMSFDEEEELS